MFVGLTLHILWDYSTSSMPRVKHVLVLATIKCTPWIWAQDLWCIQHYTRPWKKMELAQYTFISSWFSDSARSKEAWSIRRLPKEQALQLVIPLQKLDRNLDKSIFVYACMPRIPKFQSWWTFMCWLLTEFLGPRTNSKKSKESTKVAISSVLNIG